VLAFYVEWVWEAVVTYAIVVLAGSTSRLRVELARAAGGHLVGDGLDVVVGGVGGGHLDGWSFGVFVVWFSFSIGLIKKI
jgi:hypothetical protein